MYSALSSVIEKATDPTGMKALDRLQLEYTRYLLKSWRDLAGKAIAAGIATFPADNRAFTRADGREMLAEMESYLSAGMVEKVTRRTREAFEQYYRAAKTAFGKRFSFDKKTKQLSFGTHFCEDHSQRYVVAKSRAVTSIRLKKDETARRAER